MQQVGVGPQAIVVNGNLIANQDKIAYLTNKSLALLQTFNSCPQIPQQIMCIFLSSLYNTTIDWASLGIQK